jgi:hypothetical protein
MINYLGIKGFFKKVFLGKMFYLGVKNLLLINLLSKGVLTGIGGLSALAGLLSVKMKKTKFNLITEDQV